MLWHLVTAFADKPQICHATQYCLRGSTFIMIHIFHFSSRIVWERILLTFRCFRSWEGLDIFEADIHASCHRASSVNFNIVSRHLLDVVTNWYLQRHYLATLLLTGEYFQWAIRRIMPIRRACVDAWIFPIRSSRSSSHSPAVIINFVCFAKRDGRLHERGLPTDE